MSYKYTHFIKENIAPKGAKRIRVYDTSGKKIATIPLGRMAPPTKGKLYSVGVVSDPHVNNTETSWEGNAKFSNALTYFEKQGCAFCCVSGDLTQTGFYTSTSKDDFDDAQLKKYQSICAKDSNGNNRSIPVYELSGNHESYYGMPITQNLEKWGECTGKNTLYYSVPQGDDLFIFIGQPSGSTPMSDEAFDWLATTLEDNKDKRCFIFVHPDISSGNPLGKYTSNRLFDNWGKTEEFKNLLRKYENVVLFHGHSHFIFECQELDKLANYTENDGFRSVHIPSLGNPTDIVDAEWNRDKDGERKAVYLKDYVTQVSQGYLMDVYDDCIVLNGIDFITEKPVPLGTFKIDISIPQAR